MLAFLLALIGTGVIVESSVSNDRYETYVAEHYLFAEYMATCQPFSQTFTDPLSGTTMNREIRGPSEQGCAFVQDVYGPERFLCTIPDTDLALFTDSWRAQADNMDPDGGFSMKYSSDPNKQDPLTRFYNSEICTMVKE